MAKSFNVVVFRKVLNNPTNLKAGFQQVIYTRWRNVSVGGLRRMILYLDREAPDWWYVNVYLRTGRIGKEMQTEYAGRIYTNTRILNF